MDKTTRVEIPDITELSEPNAMHVLQSMAATFLPRVRLKGSLGDHQLAVLLTLDDRNTPAITDLWTFFECDRRGPKAKDVNTGHPGHRFYAWLDLVMRWCGNGVGGITDGLNPIPTLAEPFSIEALKAYFESINKTLQVEIHVPKELSEKWTPPKEISPKVLQIIKDEGQKLARLYDEAAIILRAHSRPDAERFMYIMKGVFDDLKPKDRPAHIDKLLSEKRYYSDISSQRRRTFFGNLLIHILDCETKGHRLTMTNVWKKFLEIEKAQPRPTDPPK